MIISIVFFLSLLTSQSFAEFNTLEEKVSVGHRPMGIAVNPITNKVYVTNYDSGSISVIDGSTNKVVGNITVGVFPSEVAINSETNRVYVIHRGPPGSLVSILDGQSNTVIDTIEIGFDAIGLAVNPNTNKIYVSYWNYSSEGIIFVVDGFTNKVVDTIKNATGLLAVNPVTNTIYSATGSSIYVIDGQTNKITDMVQLNGERVIDLAVNSNTNKVYVIYWNHPPTSDVGGAARATSSIFVMDGSNNIIVNTSLGFESGGIAANLNTNNAYVSHNDIKSKSVILVIDGDSNIVLYKININNDFGRLAFNPGTNKLFIVGYWTDSLSVITDPESNQSIARTYDVSSSLDGNSYTITGRADDARAMAFTINPHRSVEIEFDGQGEVELTFSKEMIDGIHTVKTGEQNIAFEQTSNSSFSTTIKFALPDNTQSVEIIGVTVVPEFPVAALILVVSMLTLIITRTKFKLPLI